MSRSRRCLLCHRPMTPFRWWQLWQRWLALPPMCAGDDRRECERLFDIRRTPQLRGAP